MVQWHMKSDRKVSGGRRRTSRRSTKKLAWKGNLFSETRLSEKEESFKVNGRGNTVKRQAKYAVYANVNDILSKKNFKAKILTITENNANRQYARRNIITKGAVIEVELNGEKVHAMVTSRPGQHGTINAVLTDFTELKQKKQKKKHDKAKTIKPEEKKEEKTEIKEKPKKTGKKE